MRKLVFLIILYKIKEIYMGQFIDLSGQKFKEITVIEKDIELSKEKKRVYWKC